MADLRPVPPLSDEESERYERQLRLDGFGIGAQRKLRSSTAFVSRVGGVGGTAAMQLTRAGIGRLVLAHGGPVHREYLNRMQLAMHDDVGRPCSEVVATRLRAINPHTEIVAVNDNVCETNVAALVEPADVIVDGAPLFEERYLMNAEALAQAKPMVTGAMYATEGYVTSIIPGQTGCLRCLFAERPADWTNIRVFPAIGPGPAIVGAMAAMEAIKLLTGFGTPLAGRLWTFDLADNFARVLHIERMADCPACGVPVAGDTSSAVGA
jgi:molybdopterin/thiamine biosynthesis adenylyltransferase